MRLIDADALFKAFENAAWYNNADRDDVAEELLLNAPTIDVEPVRHGHWIAFNVINTKDCSSKIRYMCSKCGRYEDEQEPYCNCGAKMDGDE